MITEDMTIGDVVMQYPETVPILADFGIHCVGCSASPMESLGDGLRSHSMTNSDVELVIKKLNEVIKVDKKDSVGGSVDVTEAAVGKIKAMLEKEKKPEFGLRLGVAPGGCSGFMYDLSFDAQAEGDVVVKKNGVKVFVNKDHMQFVSGSKLDFVDTLNESGFKIDNPNAKSSCGCGKSFG